MDPRVRDLAFGAALYGLGRTGGLTGNVGADLRRIGTLPAPTQTPAAAPAAAPAATLLGQDIYSGGDGSGMDMGPTGGGWENPITGITDAQGVPMTAADLIGMAAQGLSFAVSPISTIAKGMMGLPSTFTTVKGALTPVETATGMSPLTSEANALASALNIDPMDALMAITGGFGTAPAGMTEAAAINAAQGFGLDIGTPGTATGMDFGGGMDVGSIGDVGGIGGIGDVGPGSGGESPW